MQKAIMGGTSRTLLSFPLSLSRHFPHYPFPQIPGAARVLLGFRPLCALATVANPVSSIEPDQIKHEMLLERLRLRHHKESVTKIQEGGRGSVKDNEIYDKKKSKKAVAESFEEVGLSEELMGAVREMGIEVPTEIQGLGIPAVLDGKSVVLGSHTGSGKTLAYMLPLVQLLRQDEATLGMLMKSRRPRAVVLCPTRELCEQVFRVAKSISHHARFRSTMVSGGGRLRPQEDSLNSPIDMIVGTPGRVLQHIEDGNIVYGDIKYVVLDEADTMFDRGFGPDIQKFIAPLKNRASKSNGQGFQTVLVTATMTKAVQKLVDVEFQGIEHLRTSTLHKKIASARHDFIKLSGAENKLEALMQVLEPSLAKGNKVMVFCNTLNSSRAVDHFLGENQISTVNYHGEVPAEQRVKNLNKFKNEEGDCPTLVCTDLAARGLDLDVDHVIMFDFPLNSIDYLHRTGRTARMGAKGKVTSLVAKKNVLLADRIEEAIRKNESLESLTVDNVKRDVARSKITEQKGRNAKMIKVSNQRKSMSDQRESGKKFSTEKSVKASSPAKFSKGKANASSSTIPSKGKTKAFSSTKPLKGKAKSFSSTKPSNGKAKASFPAKPSKAVKLSKPVKFAKLKSSPVSKNGKSGSANSSATKLSVVGFRGRAASSNRRESSRPN